MGAKSNEQKYDEKSAPFQSIFSQDTNYKGEKLTLINSQVTKVNITSNKTCWHHVSPAKTD